MGMRAILYDLGALQAEAEAHEGNAQKHETMARHERDEADKSRLLHREQADIQRRLAAGEQVDGYTQTPSHYITTHKNADGTEYKMKHTQYGRQTVSVDLVDGERK
jgi:hypothetical protein